MKATWTLMLILVTFKSYAGLNYYPNEFLQKVEGDRNDKSFISEDELKDSIFEVLDKHHVILENGNQILASTCAGYEGLNCYQQRSLSYREARRFLFGKVHLQQDSSNEYFVKGVYCDQTYTQYTRGVGRIGPMQIPNANTLNCEHTWPQSRFSGRFPKGIQKGDLHHLFPTNSTANSIRSNHEFAEVDSVTSNVPNCEGPKLGIVNQDPRSYYFQPPKSHRGNVARALFYFSVRYQISISPVEEAFLRKWHKEDPVDEEERRRNDTVEEIQNNRNPFVDFPDLANQISDF